MTKPGHTPSAGKRKSSGRRSSKKRKTPAPRVLIPAVLIGICIGMFVGVVTTKRHNEEQQLTALLQEPLQQAQEMLTKLLQSPEEAMKEQKSDQPAYEPEKYEHYLETAAEEKTMKAGTVEFLDVAAEAYSNLFNASYPRHAYNTDAFAVDAYGRMEYADDAWFARTGIDVSEFNGSIDWEKVKADGIGFAFIRLGYRGYGEGDLYEDPYFAQNLAGAQAAGLDIGVYFFSQAISEAEAEEEAAFVVEKLAGTKLQLPVIYDAEPIRTDVARTDDVTGTQFTKNTAAFCKKIAESGYTPGYYANLKWQVFMLDMKYLENYTVWYAGYASKPQTVYDFAFWQYSDQGKVDGIAENTDLDLQIVPIADAPEEWIAAKKAYQEKKAEEARAAEEARKAEEEKAAAEAEHADGEPAAEEPAPEAAAEQETVQEETAAQE